MPDFKAKFITIEGIEGVGKSTSMKFIADFLHEQNIQYIQTREPGGTPIAEQIREVMLSHHDEEMCHDTELLLAFASRCQHLHEVIYPALKRNQWVICDRFTDATFAYQGGGRGIPLERIKAIKNWAQADFDPNLTLLLHAPIKVAFERLGNRGGLDRIELEQAQFFENAQKTYMQLANENPTRFVCIDASQSPNKVKQQVRQALQEFVNGLS